MKGIICFIAACAVYILGGLLLEYLSNEDIRPVYHLIFGVLALLILVSMCTGGCS